MRIETLREFIEFAKYQNVSTAAKKLYLTQPALSNHLAGIEKELGVELMRRGQTAELTEVGRVFFEGCCEVVGSYDELVKRVQHLAHEGGITGRLVIKAAISSQSGSMRILELINEYRRRHPMVTVKVTDFSHSSLVDELERGDVDCAQIYNYSSELKERMTNCTSITIDRAPITIAAAADHPLMRKETVSFADILDYPYAMPAGAQFEELELSVRALFSSHGAELGNVHYKIVDSITDLATVKTGGMEVLILGANPALPATMAFRLFDPPEYQEFCLVYHNDNDNPVLADFVAFIREEVAKGSSGE